MHAKVKFWDWKFEIGNAKDEIEDIPGWECFTVTYDYIKIPKLKTQFSPLFSKF